MQVVPLGERGAPLVLAGHTVAGKAVDVADLRGSIAVIRFWGSWCKPCFEDVGVLNALDARPDVAVLGVADREPSREVFEAAEDDVGVAFPSIFNPSEGPMATFGDRRPRTAPVTLVLDQKGRVAALGYGALASPEALDVVFATLAAEAAGSLPALLVVRNATPDTIWLTFNNGTKANIKPGKDVTLGSEGACSLMPLTVTTGNGAVLGTFDERCAGQTWTIRR